MNDRLLYRIYRLRARILRNMLALLSFSALLSSCSNATDKKDTVKEDSLIQVELNQKMDSLSKENAKLKNVVDSLMAKEREDSIAASKKQTTIYVAPVTPPDYGPICEYGVVPVYEDNPGQEISLYGVPVPDQDHFQTKYGVPRN